MLFVIFQVTCKNSLKMNDFNLKENNSLKLFLKNTYKLHAIKFLLKNNCDKDLEFLNCKFSFNAISKSNFDIKIYNDSGSFQIILPIKMVNLNISDDIALAIEYSTNESGIFSNNQFFFSFLNFDNFHIIQNDK